MEVHLWPAGMRLSRSLNKLEDKAMKPTLIDDELVIELHKPDVTILENARKIGKTLVKLHQPEGEELVIVLDLVLDKFSGDKAE